MDKLAARTCNIRLGNGQFHRVMAGQIIDTDSATWAALTPDQRKAFVDPPKADRAEAADLDPSMLAVPGGAGVGSDGVADVDGPHPGDDATVLAVIDWVGADQGRAAEAYEIEGGRGNKARPTLVDTLRAIIDDE